MRRLVTALALLATALPAASAATPPIAIVLEGPPSGSVTPRYAASPLFRWRIFARHAAPLHGSGRLEVSTTPNFSQSAIVLFDCGFGRGDCPVSDRFGARRPFWYDQADPCSDIPPVGDCGRPAPLLYWRVRFEPVGGRSWSSPVGVVRFATPRDRKPPAAAAFPSTSAYGATAVFRFDAADNGGVVRDEVELFDGKGRVVFGARTDWNGIGVTPERLMDEPLPASIRPGRYRWCLTVVDAADNRTTSCATYTLERP